TIVEVPADRAAQEIEEVPAVSFSMVLEQFGFDSALIVKMDIEGAELGLFEDPDWLSRTDILMVELHERIAPGIEAAFREANKLRFVSKTGGEKYLSVGDRYFGRNCRPSDDERCMVASDTR